jgi:type 1 glutamine amidotransferase
MHVSPNRRDLLKSTAFIAAGLALSPLVARGQEPGSSARKKVLFFTKSSGYQHSVITRPKDDPTKLAYAEQILTDLGAKHGFDVTCSKDGTIFTPENIAKFDVFAFYTTMDLTQDSDKYDTKKGPDGKNVPDPTKLLHKEPAMPPGAKEAFLEAIKNGKGFVGFHSATDTFHSGAKAKGNMLRDLDDKGQDAFDPYIQMIGGEFIRHGKQQQATLKAVDTKFPGAAAFDNATIHEEWYSLKNFAPDLHVILVQETAGMIGAEYQRAPYPQTWSRMHGKGRVFYTSMGHREDVWQKPEFIDLVVGALKWTARLIEADVAPNIRQVTPQADVAKNLLSARAGTPTTQRAR